MITLQPIAKNIQQTLYEKMEMMKKTGGRSPNNRSYTIGEVVTSNSDPNLNYMMARSSWLRMVSLTPVNANNEAIIIMGGELTEKGGLKGEFVSHLQNGMGGKYSSIYYVHKYSPTDRRYDWIKKRTMPLRPLPGIKEASIEY